MRDATSASMLVAAHARDIAGANWAGLHAAFIARSGQQMFSLADPPDIDIVNFLVLSEALGA